MDDNHKAQLLILIIGALMGGGIFVVNSSYLWSVTLSKEKLDISEGISIDISALNQNLLNIDQSFLENSNNDKYIFLRLTPIYPDNGLYFSYQRDISKLDRKVANDTFVFYHHLLAAELYRNDIYVIQNGKSTSDLTTTEFKQQQLLTQNIAYEINESVKLLPVLKQELG
jgi:hypothetical protein